MEIPMPWNTCEAMLSLQPWQREQLRRMIESSMSSIQISEKLECSPLIVKLIRERRHRDLKNERRRIGYEKAHPISIERKERRVQSKASDWPELSRRKFLTALKEEHPPGLHELSLQTQGQFWQIQTSGRKTHAVRIGDTR